MTAKKPTSHTSGIPHEVRTAAEPRQDRLYPVRLTQITHVNPTVRLLRLTLQLGSSLTRRESGGSALDESHSPFNFLPGQWLDVHIPSIPRAGGFTITSTPEEAADRWHQTNYEEVDDHSRSQGRHEPYIELAVQKSPSNPPAAWLWRPEEQILGTDLKVRVGGSFVWPPPLSAGIESVKKVVFVAGGVGINPLVSMLSHIHQNRTSLLDSTQLHLLYSTRLPEPPEGSVAPSSFVVTSKQLDKILFLPRIREMVRAQVGGPQDTKDQPTARRTRLDLQLYVTNLNMKEQGRVTDVPEDIAADMTLYNRRITRDDLRIIVSSQDPKVRSGAVCYVCGPPQMTDEFVEILGELLESGNNTEKRVFYEKWW
ncbi:hypothetical protein VTO42DRAFT_5046 [Malbranchea cinnamomea]